MTRKNWMCCDRIIVVYGHSLSRQPTDGCLMPTASALGRCPFSLSTRSFARTPCRITTAFCRFSVGGAEKPVDLTLNVKRASEQLLTNNAADGPADVECHAPTSTECAPWRRRWVYFGVDASEWPSTLRVFFLQPMRLYLMLYLMLHRVQIAATALWVDCNNGGHSNDVDMS